MYYPEEVIEDVRRHNDIVDVVGSCVHLKRSGSGYAGLCPFHSEKTASFNVNPSRQIFKCFGCGKGGNVFTFVMEYENMNFVEALKFLADRAGIKLPEADMSSGNGEKAAKKAALMEIYKKAATWFYRQLRTPEGRVGYEYFKKRGLLDETIVKFGLGFSPKTSPTLYDYLKSEGYSDQLLKDSELFTFNEAKGIRDKFWNRVMFPIMDRNSKVIAFGGRVMGDGLPKYLNSNETEIFYKSRNLYALNLARRSKSNFFLLCEGYMDVISLHQAGFDNAVASLGTAFTGLQANLITRYTRSVVITYDSDGAGRKAALKAIPILRSAGITARVLSMDPYKDPDEFIKALGREEYAKRIEDAIPGFIFEVRSAEKEYDMSNPEEKTKFFNRIAVRMLEFEDELERNTYIDAVVKMYNISFNDLKHLVNKKAANLSRAEIASENAENVRYDEEKPFAEDKGSTSLIGDKESFKRERLLLTWSLERKSYGRMLLKYLSPEMFQEGTIQSAAVLCFNQIRDNRETVEAASIINHFETAEEQNLVSELFQAEIWEQMKDDKKATDKAFCEAAVKLAERDLKRKIDRAAAEENGETSQNLMKQLIDNKKLGERIQKDLTESGD